MKVAATDDWLDDDHVRHPASGGRADRVQAVCHRCRAAVEGRTSKVRRWTGDSPRP